MGFVEQSEIFYTLTVHDLWSIE